ncbi:hypothetical protein HYX10_00480 [Candidatus Woesearchaeota archaeon]|nr:hypothetical protein [Candidatus Woesearchaeota archaeon]
MAKKVISLSVDEQVYDDYKSICERKGWILSRQFENFMRNELDKSNKKVIIND